MIPTRASLLARLKDISQDESWREFFDTYWKLIYNTARRKGLVDVEAQEVVQETMISVSKSMPQFKYDPDKGSFKLWLRNLTLWRIQDQFRKRSDNIPLDSTFDIPEKGSQEDQHLAAEWESDWEKNLINSAIERVKSRTSPNVFQIFTLCELQKKGARETAQILGVNIARVYLISHRLTKAITKEVAHLRKTTIRAV